jgi:hypothetical protein
VPDLQIHPLQPILTIMAPALDAAAEYARNAQSDLLKTPWGRTYLTTPAVAGRVGGVARWSICAEHLVTRPELLPKGVSVDSSPSEHRAGQYRLKCSDPVFTLTVKRDAHRQGEEPEGIVEILAQAPVGSDKWIVTLQVHAPGEGATRLLIRADDDDVVEQVFMISDLLATVRADAGTADVDLANTTPLPAEPTVAQERGGLPIPDVFSDEDATVDVDGSVSRVDEEETDVHESK